jgi:hypothetical protein
MTPEPIWRSAGSRRILLGVRNAATTVLAVMALGACVYFVGLRLAHGRSLYCLESGPRVSGQACPPRSRASGSDLWAPPIAVVIAGLALSAMGVLKRHKRVIARAEEINLGGRPLTRRSW